MTQISEQQLLDIFKELSEEDRNQLFLQGHALTAEGKSAANKIEQRLNEIKPQLRTLIKSIENRSKSLYKALDSAIADDRTKNKYLGVYVFHSNIESIPLSIISAFRTYRSNYSSNETKYCYQIASLEDYHGEYDGELAYDGESTRSTFYHFGTDTEFLDTLKEDKSNDLRDVNSLYREGYTPLTEADKYLDNAEHSVIKDLLKVLSNEVDEFFALLSEFINLLNKVKADKLNVKVDDLYKFYINNNILPSSRRTNEIGVILDKETDTYKIELIDWYTSAGSCW